MGLTERREADRRLSEARRKARQNFTDYKEKAADADREYRMIRARVFAEMKSKGGTDKAAEMSADAESANARHDRDLNEALAKSALLRIQEIERDSVSVRDIHQTSERIDGLGA